MPGRAFDNDESSRERPGSVKAGSESGPRANGKQPDPLKEMRELLSALGDYTAHFLSAKWDGARVRVRTAAIGLVFRCVGLIILIAVVISLWLDLLRGAAGGLSVAVGGRAWLGELLAGAIGLATVAGAAALASQRTQRRRRRDRIRKFERRKSRQRTRYGQDVDQAA